MVSFMTKICHAVCKLFDISVITYFVDLHPYGNEGKSTFRLSFLRNSGKIIRLAVDSLYKYSYIHMELLNKVIININMAVCIASLIS